MGHRAGEDVAVTGTSHSRSRTLTAVGRPSAARGAELVGELERDEDSDPVRYVRGPEGIIIELGGADRLKRRHPRRHDGRLPRIMPEEVDQGPSDGRGSLRVSAV